ncbi:hypothetical protein [Undibacterium sp. Tian12W]|uniref:hypothetical protein n=1 Tax=Undibacterium sp. Tian12W TaxID=3413054 RepID=UPI003BEFAB14
MVFMLMPQKWRKTRKFSWYWGRSRMQALPAPVQFATRSKKNDGNNNSPRDFLALSHDNAIMWA